MISKKWRIRKSIGKGLLLWDDGNTMELIVKLTNLVNILKTTKLYFIGGEFSGK